MTTKIMQVNGKPRQATIASMALDADRDKATHKQCAYDEGGVRPFTRYTPKGPVESEREEYCSNCRYFAEPSGTTTGGTACSLVRSPIHKTGWCQWWHPMDPKVSGVAEPARAAY